MITSVSNYSELIAAKFVCFGDETDKRSKNRIEYPSHVFIMSSGGLIHSIAIALSACVVPSDLPEVCEAMV